MVYSDVRNIVVMNQIVSWKSFVDMLMQAYYLYTLVYGWIVKVAKACSEVKYLF